MLVLMRRAGEEICGDRRAACARSELRLRFDPALFRGSDAGAAAARANLTLGQRRMATGALFNLRRSSASCRRR